jgi:thiosulfate dehydrogenase [quinone] large subunit
MDNRTKGEYAMAVFRIMVGWIMLWPFMDKLLGLGFETPSGSGMIDGGSPSSFVTYVTSGIFADFYNSVAGNQILDFILMAALLIMGLTLMLGFAAKLTTFWMAVFLVIMYSLQVPPTSNPLIDYHLILVAGLVATYYLGGFERLSIYGWWKELALVKRFPILE